MPDLSKVKTEKTTIRCELFGHRPAGPGWWGDVPYVQVRQSGTDNVNRIHGTLYHECRRCGTKYLAGRIHLNDPVITKALGLPPWYVPA